jgi:hypothetical protein
VKEWDTLECMLARAEKAKSNMVAGFNSTSAAAGVGGQDDLVKGLAEVRSQSMEISDSVRPREDLAAPQSYEY